MSKKSSSEKIQLLSIAILVFLSAAYSYRDYDQNKNNIQNLQSQIQNISLSQNTQTNLVSLWEAGTTEFVACMHGYVINDTIYVTSISLPKNTYHTSENDVEISGCVDNSLIGYYKEKFSDDKVVGTIHNHRSGICILTDKDQYVFGQLGDRVMGVMCELDRFKFYTPNSFISPIHQTIN